MSARKSRWICERCGLSVHSWASGAGPDGYVWKHAAPGQHGKTPRHMKHKPEPVERPGWTPLDESALREALKLGEEQS